MKMLCRNKSGQTFKFFFGKLILKILFKISCANLKNGHFDRKDV